MNELTPVMLCLRCGYAQKARGGANYTREDRAHHARCDFTMTIRYRDARGRITGGPHAEEDRS
jgi:hypothetical protein